MTTTQHPLTGWGVALLTTENDLETCQGIGTIRAVVPTDATLGDCALVDFLNETNGNSYMFSQLVPLTRLMGPASKLFSTEEGRDKWLTHHRYQYLRIVK